MKEIKYYCDICGKELRENEFKGKIDIYHKGAKSLRETKSEVCTACVYKVDKFIKKLCNEK